MSIFIHSSCQVIGDTAVNHLSWSHTQQIVVLSTYSIDDQDKETNKVLFANSDGELIPQQDIESEFEASVFDWHPTDKLLAVGWSDGTVMIVDVKQRPTVLFTSSSYHNAGVSVLRWSPNGKRLVSGDKRGLIIIWSPDQRGNLSVLRQYRKKGELTAVAFCALSARLHETQLKGKLDIKSSSYTPSFFVGTDRGSIIFADDIGHCTDVHQLSSAIDMLLFFEEKSRLVILTRSLLLTQYYLSEEGKLSRVMQVKLSISSDISEKGIRSVTWATPGVLVACTEEKVVRFFDLVADESYNISLQHALGAFVDRNDRVTCVAFNPVDRYLAVGTFGGVVAIWKFVGALRDLGGTGSVATSPQDWELIFRVSVGSSLLQLQWWHGRGLLGAVTEDETIIFNETLMSGGVCSDLGIVQRTVNEVLAFNGLNSEPKLINCGLQIKGLAVARTCFVVWSGKIAKVFRLDSVNQKFISAEPFKCMGIACAVADSSSIIEDAVFIAEGAVVRIVNFAGTQKGTISFNENEGPPHLVDLNGKFLVSMSTKGYIKVFDVHTPTKPKQLGSTTPFFLCKERGLSVFENEGSFVTRSIKINSTGTMVALLVDRIGSQEIHYPDNRLYVFDRYRGTLFTYNFSELKRFPTAIFWDESDERLVAAESSKIREFESSPNHKSAESEDRNSPDDTERKPLVEVCTFFVTSEHGIILQDSISSESNNCSCIGLNAPKLYFRKTLALSGTAEEISVSEIIFTKVMRDFAGISQITETLKTSLLDFSFFLTLGKLDEAYRVVKEIDSPVIWENMAQMCVKTKRLDVAEVCLGNMGHARGAAAVRDSKRENSLEVSIAVLAIQLGLLDDAAKLFKEANRFDLLNQLYQCAGLWEKAIKTAESNDRIHLKSTHYLHARYLENLGRIDDAIEHYQFSETARTEVPRMLFHLGRIEELNEYVMRSDDSSLLRWWASYLESIDRLDKARKYYSKAKDYLSLVRIYCFQGDFQKAVDTITESSDRASAYHFARQMESQGEFQEAIRFYALSGCYNHSIRLARAYNLDSELMRFAVKSTQALMIDCAQHFESKEEYDKAIQLYHKGGDIPRALELCFRIGEDRKHPHANVAFDMLNTIAQDLGVDSSPQTLARCADFLVQNRQYNKAIELYVMAKRYLAAIEMCVLNRVALTEEMVQTLTPSESLDVTERKEVLMALGKALKKQGAFTLASKKYTQAGDRIRAMKCLVRSGDTKAVIQFANISRNNEIYTLAANYLQQMNWRENVDIMKAIITFYNKAKAFVQLGGFYESCAQVEIDEYRDYEKALGALNEAAKWLSKDTSRTAKEILSNLDKRIMIVEKFIEAKSHKDNNDIVITICEALLQDPLVEDAIRIGDCLSLLIDTFCTQGNYAEAYHYLKELQQRNENVYSYIDEKTESIILRAVGVEKTRIPSESKSQRHEDTKHSEDEVIEEEIDEELDGYYDSKGSNRKRW